MSKEAKRRSALISETRTVRAQRSRSVGLLRTEQCEGIVYRATRWETLPPNAWRAPIVAAGSPNRAGAECAREIHICIIIVASQNVPGTAASAPLARRRRSMPARSVPRSAFESGPRLPIQSPTAITPGSLRVIALHRLFTGNTSATRSAVISESKRRWAA